MRLRKQEKIQILSEVWEFRNKDTLTQREIEHYHYNLRVLRYEHWRDLMQKLRKVHDIWFLDYLRGDTLAGENDDLSTAEYLRLYEKETLQSTLERIADAQKALSWLSNLIVKELNSRKADAKHKETVIQFRK